MDKDIVSNVSVNPSLVPAARTASGTGITVNTQGFDSAFVEFTFGAITDGTHTPSVLQSVDGVTFVPCVYGTDLDASMNLTAVSSSAGANTVQQIGYIGSQRYLAVVMTTTGATSGAISSASVIAGFPRSGPTQ